MKIIGSTSFTENYINGIVDDPKSINDFMSVYEDSINSNATNPLYFPPFPTENYLNELETRKKMIEADAKLYSYSQDQIKLYKTGSATAVTNTYIVKYTQDVCVINSKSWQWGASSAENTRDIHEILYGNIYTRDNQPDILPGQLYGCSCEMLIIEN